ncbi:50S ribosomal protein L10 [Candidatus Kuenenbacteria bacterium HGW-Kuenenbacteria-1]|uniref:Large ribosomal subunit protein uL10 n=1 Tax=Candidatus Kuenenbacteria bacterium HGW-Kuenenbacteria-1 TaxID=2013812 RepID=A0A2N1UNV4_9BACT|nr:MAG: 50S ribosomal protein L10 [Candidatus Kuenenbacteria bacterium HGW-Kuenenbacteria-1]
MAKTKEQKQETIKQLSDKLSQMKSMVFINYYGLKVIELQKLRKLCKEQKIDFLVTKKKLFKLCLEKNNLNNIASKKLEKELGIIFSYEDEIAPAKILKDFQKEHKILKISGGILERNFIEPNEILKLAQLPSKQELIAMVVKGINAPISGFVNVLAGNLRNFVCVLQAIKEKNI